MADYSGGDLDAAKPWLIGMALFLIGLATAIYGTIQVVRSSEQQAQRATCSVRGGIVIQAEDYVQCIKVRGVEVLL